MPPSRPAKRSSFASAIWIIIDGKRHIATGCLKGQAREAEQRLAAYIAQKYQPTRHARDIDRIDIATCFQYTRKIAGRAWSTSQSLTDA